MMNKSYAFFGLLLSLLCFQSAALAADARMVVDLLAETQKVELDVLHANVNKAAALALPKLWARIIPVSAQSTLPKHVKAIGFLQKAVPTEDGVVVTFQHQRVMAFLQKHTIPFIPTQPVLNIVLQIYSVSGRPMRHSANDLLDIAVSNATEHGYSVDDQGESLVLLWRWLDARQVSLTVRGNSKAGEYSETRNIGSGDPVQQLQPWMMQVLLKARDAYAESIPAPSAMQFNTRLDPLLGLSSQPIAKPEIELRLSVQRPAGLADQVSFEQELELDPRILSLSLRQVTKDGQQYRLKLKGSDDVWLTEWFARRGMTLTPTLEGWVAR